MLCIPILSGDSQGCVSSFRIQTPFHPWLYHCTAPGTEWWPPNIAEGNVEQPFLGDIHEQFSTKTFGPDLNAVDLLGLPGINHPFLEHCWPLWHCCLPVLSFLLPDLQSLLNPSLLLFEHLRCLHPLCSTHIPWGHPGPTSLEMISSCLSMPHFILHSLGSTSSRPSLSFLCKLTQPLQVCRLTPAPSLGLQFARTCLIPQQCEVVQIFKVFGAFVNNTPSFVCSYKIPSPRPYHCAVAEREVGSYFCLATYWWFKFRQITSPP